MLGRGFCAHSKDAAFDVERDIRTRACVTAGALCLPGLVRCAVMDPQTSRPAATDRTTKVSLRKRRASVHSGKPCTSMKPVFRYLPAVAFLAFALTLDAASTVPKPLETPSPGYPAALTDTGQKGSATIEVIVKADGSVAEAQVKSADREAFGEAARAAIEKWRFEPATADGKAVDKRVTVPFNFVPPVTQMLNAKFKRKVFQAVPEAVLSQKEYGR